MADLEDLPSDVGARLAGRFVPYVLYDSQSPFRSVAASALTDNPGNLLVSRGEVVAASSGVPVLSLQRLAADRRSGDDGDRCRLKLAPDRFVDASRLQGDERYADRVYSRAVRSANHTI